MSMIELAQHFLSEMGYHFSRRGEAESLQGSFSAENGTYSVFFETNEEQALVGVYVYAPSKVSASKRGAVMEYLTRLNYGLRSGGFEFDLDDGEVRYTQNMDIEGATLTSAIVLNMLHFALDVMDDYYPGLMRIIYADADPKRGFRNVEIPGTRSSPGGRIAGDALMRELTMNAQQTVSRRDRFRGCLLGLAAGDAVGTTLEFRMRGSFEPLTDMVGGGPFRLDPGEWTDDTSMALCLAASLIERRGFDPKDQMDRYLRWRDEGYMSSNGRCFDIGNTVADALKRYRQTGEPYAGSDDPRSAGNGSLMRLAPVVLYFSRAPREEALKFAELSSRTTHGARECLDACRLSAEMLLRALAGAPKEAILFDHEPDFVSSPKIASIACGDYRYKSEVQIRGTGYVVASLEAALWCFLNTDSFEAAILRAANLGDDADTTAAICGQIAGAYYGESGIPERWLERLVMADEIRAMADELATDRA